MDISNQLTGVFQELSKQVQEQVTRELVAQVTREISRIDFSKLIRDQITDKLEEKIQSMEFPNGSIPVKSIDLTGLVLSGDAIEGGIIKNFGSTGIDDQATTCQVTILDTHTVIESPILTTGLEVRGTAKIDGDLIIGGQISTDSKAFKDIVLFASTEVKKSIDEDLFQEYSNLVVDNIRERGIEFSEVLINGKLTLSETKLGPAVVHSNLRRVGELEELRVKGESFLSESLYTSNKRVGINTLEPAAALAVWDQEVEILAGKKSQNRAYIGTARNTNLSLVCNNKECISLETDGSVVINDLRLGSLPISTTSIEPNWSGRAGEIVFNDSPAVGKPLGWVCIEGHRWAKFAIITE